MDKQQSNTMPPALPEQLWVKLRKCSYLKFQPQQAKSCEEVKQISLKGSFSRFSLGYYGKKDLIVTLQVFPNCSFPQVEIIQINQSQMPSNEFKAKKYSCVLESYCPNLKTLIVSVPLNTQFFDTFLVKKFNKLQKLNLRNTQISYEGIKKLFSSDNLQKIKILDLGVNSISKKGILILANTHLPCLVELYLNGNKIRKMGSLELFRKGNWKQLTTINLGECQVNDGIQNIHQAQWKQLTYLKLTHNRITSPNAIFRLTQAQFPHLQQLFLDCTKNADPKWWGALKKSKWPKLTHLSVNYCNLGNQFIKTIVSIDWPCLQYLSMSGNRRITNYGINYIYRKSYWPKLKQFHLKQVILNKKGVSLLSQTYWPQIKVIKIEVRRKYYNWRLLRSPQIIYMSKCSRKNVTILDFIGFRILE